MKRLSLLLVAALASAALSHPANAAPKAEKLHSSASQTVSDLENRGAVAPELADRIKADPDAPVTRYDIASFVARAMEISSAARGQRISKIYALTKEMRESTVETGSRLDRLIEQQQELRKTVQELREKRHRD